jgi:GT2 family glycosyltransferase
MAEVSVIIVNYQTPKLTKGAVRSCLDEPEVAEVLVVDNNSEDGSVDEIWNEFKNQNVRVVESDSNAGFGAANNRGVKRARSPYVFLLNSDAFMLEGCLPPLLAKMKEAEDIAIVAPEILEADARTEQDGNYGPFPTLHTIFTRDDEVEDELEPDWVSGVAMLVHREAFLDIGGFDEKFFMYFEDVDLCRRFHQNDKRVLREPKAKVVHFGGGSQNSDFKKKKMYYASQDRYLELTGVQPAGAALVRATRWPVYLTKSLFARK